MPPMRGAYCFGGDRPSFHMPLLPGTSLPRIQRLVSLLFAFLKYLPGTNPLRTLLAVQGNDLLLSAR
jgi:hypothetical protein